jgi:Zn-dependent alcohol dehydrogenase
VSWLEQLDLYDMVTRTNALEEIHDGCRGIVKGCSIRGVIGSAATDH